MIVDGRALAEEIKRDLRTRAKGSGLVLAVVWVGEDPVSEKYIERKKKFGADLGVEVVVYEYPSDIAEQDLIEEVTKLNNDEKINGVIVQLPIPSQINQEKILNLISPEKDVDALTSEARVLSPTVGAIKEILEHYHVELKNKKVVVLGHGQLVGRPVSIWLTQEGANVEIIDINTKNPESILQQADIIVSGVGKSDLITPEKIKDGVVLIDAGTSELPSGQIGASGKIIGDANPACADKCSLFTPVPGGVGPLTVAMLFKNLLELNR